MTDQTADGSSRNPFRVDDGTCGRSFRSGSGHYRDCVLAPHGPEVCHSAILPVDLTDQTADLRERAIQAIHALEFDAADPSVEEYADAVLALVQPLLDAKDAEIERLTDLVGSKRGDVKVTTDTFGVALRRAETAEAALADATGVIERVRALHTQRRGLCIIDGFWPCATIRALAGDSQDRP